LPIRARAHEMTFDCRISTIIGAIFTALLFPSIATAQVTLPGSAQPGRAEQPLLEQPLQPKSTELTTTTADEAEAAVPDVDVTFTLRQVLVEGSTVIPDADFKELYQLSIGQEVSVALVFEIAQKATALYRERGYILSQVIIPPQEIDGGVVRLRAIEGFVDKVVISGDVGSRRDLVAAYGDKIKADRPLNSKTLERYLLLAGDLAGLDIQGVFSPSEQTTGAATLTIQSNYDRVEAAFEVSNYGSNFVGPETGMAEITLNSVFGQHERLGARGALSADGDELQFGEIFGSVPVGTEGTSLFGRISGSKSDPGNGLEAFNIANDSFRWSVGVSHPVIRSRRKNLFVGLQFDWDDLKSDSNFGQVVDDHLRVARATVDYDFVDTALGGNLPAVTAMQVRLSQGFASLGATSSSDANRSRPNADGSYTAIEGEIQRYQRLGMPGVTLLMAARGQYSSQPVLSSVEFGFGGSEYGRGFDPSAIVGDRGVAGKLELQYQQPAPDTLSFLETYQFFAFLDGGIIQNVAVSGPDPSVTERLYSTGGGMRFDFLHGFEAEIALAWLSEATDNNYSFGNGQWRGLFRVARKY